MELIFLLKTLIFYINAYSKALSGYIKLDRINNSTFVVELKIKICFNYNRGKNRRQNNERKIG